MIRLIHSPADPFGAVNLVAAFSSSAKLLRPLLNLGVVLLSVIERGYHNVPTLSAIRVVAIVPNHPTKNAVIVRVHRRHAGSLRLKGCWEHWATCADHAGIGENPAPGPPLALTSAMIALM